MCFLLAFHRQAFEAELFIPFAELWSLVGPRPGLPIAAFLRGGVKSVDCLSFLWSLECRWKILSCPAVQSMNVSLRFFPHVYPLLYSSIQAFVRLVMERTSCIEHPLCARHCTCLSKMSEMAPSLGGRWTVRCRDIVTGKHGEKCFSLAFTGNAQSREAGGIRGGLQRRPRRQGVGDASRQLLDCHLS